MSANCLKTTLRAVVQNDSLPVLGCIIITPKAIDDLYYKLVIKSSSAVTVKARGNAHLAETIAELVTNPKTEVSGTNFTCYLPGEDAVFVITKRDAITDFTFEQCNSSGNKPASVVQKKCFDIANVQYMTSLGLFDVLGTCYGDLSVLKDAILLQRTLYLVNNTFINTSLDNLPLNVEGLYVQNSNVGEDDKNETGGNLYKLGKMTSLISVYTNGYINGSIESLVASFVENGRSSGTVTFVAVGSQSISFGSYHLLRFKLEWDGVTKITAIQSNGNNIYAKGATAEEIAAWEQDGKTVNVVE